MTWLARRLDHNSMWVLRRLNGTTRIKVEDVDAMEGALGLSRGALYLADEKQGTPGGNDSEGSTSSSGDELGDEESVQSA